MKIVDVIGEKIYKDGDRIITQVRGGESPPEELVHHLSSHFGELMLQDTRAHFLQGFLMPLDVHLTDMQICCLHSPFCGFWCLFFWMSFSFDPEQASFMAVKTWGRSNSCALYLLSVFGTEVDS